MKRSFRRTAAERPEQPRYPTLEHFDRSRREALLHLGAIGAAVLGGAGLLAACGDRSVASPQDGSPSGLDGRTVSGTAPCCDARTDEQRPLPDQRLPDANLLEGGADEPDARVDEPDLSGIGGGAPLPPAPGDAGR